MATVYYSTAQLQAIFAVAATVSATTKTVSGAVALNTLVELTVTAHGWSTGTIVQFASIVGTTEANGIFTVTVIDANHVTIPVTFVNAYTSGGTGAIATFTSGLIQAMTPNQVGSIREELLHTVSTPGGTLGTLLATAP